MKPNRYEWLHQERARVAREGTGHQFVTYQLRRHYLRSLGIAGVMLPLITALTKLPTQPTGAVRSFPLLVLALATIIIGVFTLRSGISRHLAGWWAGWTAVGFGALLILASLLV